jgi:hypothetical protein
MIDAKKLWAHTERLLSECDALVGETQLQVEALKFQTLRTTAATERFARKVPESGRSTLF